MHRRSVVILGVLVLLAAGYAASRYVVAVEQRHAREVEQAFQRGQLLEEVRHAGLVAGALHAMDEGDPAKARHVLEFALTSALQEADRLAAAGVPLDGIAVPNLREGLRRAGEYARDHGLAVAAEKAERAEAQLTGGTDG